MENLIKLELSLDEINVIIKGLSKLPLEESLVVFTKVKENAEKQLTETKNGGSTG